MRLTLNYDNYGSLFFQKGISPGGSTYFNGHISKSIISIGIAPINFKIKNKIRISFGVLFSKLLIDKSTGTFYHSTMGTTSDINSVNMSKLNKPYYWGMTGNIAYDYKITNFFTVAPQLTIYNGFSDEFSNPKNIKSFRFILGIAFRKDLNIGGIKESKDYFEVDK
jgi:hypothetical protein